MAKIAPSIWAADFMELRRDIRMVESAGADYLHCDVMDGMYVTELSFGWKMIEAFRRETKLPLDVHLMIRSPERYIGEFARAGADMVTVHAEAASHLQRTLAEIRAHGVRAGVLEDVDMALVMSVNPGFSGERFLPGSLRKIEALRNRIDQRGLPVEIEVDGAISAANARDIINAGADVLVVGRSVFGAEEPEAELENIRRAARLCGARGGLR